MSSPRNVCWTVWCGFKVILEKLTNLLFPLGTPSPQGSREFTPTGKSARRNWACPAQPSCPDLVQSMPLEPQALPYSLRQLLLRCPWASHGPSDRVSKPGIRGHGLSRQLKHRADLLRAVHQLPVSRFSTVSTLGKRRETGALGPGQLKPKHGPSDNPSHVHCHSVTQF